jgi:beta-lactamase regulating signal transducer with metallopeptidase domain
MLSAVLDHLWQSTLVALAAGILIAAAFRKASAAVRHGLWLAASLKFLIPFAALAALGRYLAAAGLTPAGTAPEAALVERAARPLAQFPFAHHAVLQAPPVLSALPQAPLAHAPAPLAQAAPHLDLALIILAVWAFGCGAVVMAWAIRWARVRRIVRSATPIAWPAPMPVLASPSLMEPGLIGFLRPVLVVPETLPERLTRSEIDAILAHEISHLRRRDNLTALVHMLVEALFWFHPLVWWIGARLIAERERACDEAVVRSGHDRAAYARSLVESCRLYLQSPLSCVAGASGSDLKTRVEMIMTASPSSPLTPLKKALLLAAGGCAFATPVAAGLLTSPEGQKAVARASAAASIALGAPAAQPTPAAANDAAKPVVLARNEAVQGPALNVARLDVAATPLSHDIAAPPAVTAAPQPVQLAVASPPPATRRSAAPAAAAVSEADAKTQAAEFVKAYADATPFRTVGRWASGICVRVVGLPSDQEAAVRIRVNDVAANLGLPVGAQCRYYNIQIGFAEDAQAMLDRSVKGSKVNPLGDRTSDTRQVKTVTLPVQAWYVTNGELYAQNDRNENDRSEANGLKVRVLYQTPANPSGMPSGSFSPSGGSFPTSSYFAGYGSGSSYEGIPSGSAAPSPGVRAFTNVMVIVDLRRTANTDLGVLADYAAMLALSEPRALGQCNTLPSITDLFANCPGRSAPDGLTAADTAYLDALYSARGATFLGSSHESHIIQRMADLLAHPKLASR